VAESTQPSCSPAKPWTSGESSSPTKTNKRLILYAEMKLPGEAWLEFSIKDGWLTQKATFRPLGLFGRMYWYALLPLHLLVFSGMSRKVADG
jgi:hypothetical protein